MELGRILNNCLGATGSLCVGSVCEAAVQSADLTDKLESWNFALSEVFVFYFKIFHIFTHIPLS